MATSGLYGSSPTGVTVAAPGSETSGLYGNGTTFGGTYFEWFIFIQSATQPATPTGGSWSFTTNSGTPPSGWSSTPPSAPTLPVWGSIALVNSANSAALTWSAPGLFAYAQGLPVLSGTDIPLAGDGVNNQLYVQTGSTPQTIWLKESGTWTRLTGSTLYVDLVNNQTIAGTKTFSSQIQGSVSGTSSNVSGTVAIANGGTGQITATGALNALLPSQTGNTGKYLTTDGSNASWQPTTGAGTVTSVNVSGGTTGLTTSGGPITAAGTITLAGTLAIANGGTGATTSGTALTNLGAAGDITSADASIVVTRVGSSVDLSVSTTSPASVLLEQVRNTTGATLTKGTAVYISGATGQIPTVSKALATSDATSAQTLGLITSDLPNNSNGYVTIIGLVANLNTSAYTDGQQLYLSPTTAGTLTATKPYAPQHLVYMAVVAHAHPTQGKLLVKVQNGYELDELHNVAAQSPTTGQTIVWNGATSLWEKNTVSLTVGVNGTLPVANGGTGVTTSTGTGSVVLSTSPTLVTPLLGTPTSGNFSTGTFTWPTFNQNTTGTASNVTGIVAIANGGTGQTTANAAFNALAPSQTGNSGKYLTTDGSNTSWATNPLGTVTSVAASVPAFLSITGSPITTSGTLAFGLSGTALPTTSGGTGLTSFTANGIVYASSTSALTTGSALTFDGSKLINTGYNKSSYQVSVGGVGSFEASGGAYLSYASGANLYSMLNSSGTEDIFNYRASEHLFYIGGVEQARLNSTGLGLGTNSPGSKLDVKGTLRLSGSTSGYVGLAPAAAAGSTTYTLPSADGTNGQTLITNGSGVLSWATNASGDVLGPSSATNNALARFDGTTGKLIKDSSALTFDGTNLFSTGSITLDTNLGIFFSGLGGTNAGVYGRASGTEVAFNASNAEAMRLTSTGLGIGTSSPSDKLTVVSTAQYSGATIQGGATNGASILTLKNSDAAGNWALGVYGSGISNTGNNLYIYDNVAGAVRLVMNSSGNLGLNVTPSAFSGAKFLQINGAMFAGDDTIWRSRMLVNAYNDGNYKYLQSNYAQMYVQNSSSGDHTWHISASGTAGNVITFTQAMTLNASGNLGIGATSSLKKLTVQGSTTERTVEVIDNGSNDAAIMLQLSGVQEFTLGVDRTDNSFKISDSGALGTNDRFVIDSSGNLSSTGSNTSATYFQRSIAPATESGTETAIVTTGNGDNQRAGMYAFNDYANNLSTALIFKTNATTGSASERARITSSGDFGIGTSSPAYKLDVLGTSRIYQSSNTSASLMLNANQGTIGTGYAFTLAQTNSAGNYNFTIAEGATTYLTLTNSISGAGGNLGLGVTPSAWSVNYKALQSGNGSAFVGFSGNNQTFVVSNAYNDGSWKYKETSGAGYYAIQGVGNGVHAWYTAASGTAGTAITFTQAMTLTAAGKLCLNRTDTINGAWLAIQAENNQTAIGTIWADNTYMIQQRFSSEYFMGIGGDAANRTLSLAANSADATANITFLTSGNGTLSERARIIHNGNFGIGTASPNKLLTVYSSTNDVEVLRINVNGGAGGVQAKGDIGFGYYDTVSEASAAIGFEEFSAGSVGASLLFKTRPDGSSDSTRPSERARINASGNFILNGTSVYASSLFTNYTNGSNGISNVQNIGGGYSFISNAASNAGSYYHASFEEAATQRGSIISNGTTTSYNVTSDYRLKTVIGEVTGHGARIDALEPIEYTWNSNGLRTRGFLAHKFQEVYADSVTGTKDAVDADGKPVYQQMQASTAEVIADLVAEIQSLRKRLADAGI